MSLEALAVDDRGTRVIVLVARHPHLLEGRERREEERVEGGELAEARREARQLLGLVQLPHALGERGGRPAAGGAAPRSRLR